MTGECFLCGNYETLERHHLFGGAFRKKADRLKLTVMLCPWCHQIDADSAHKSAETRLYLHKYGQARAMKEQGWTADDFVREFGRNYLDEEEIRSLTEVPADDGVNSFRVLEREEALPW